VTSLPRPTVVWALIVTARARTANHGCWTKSSPPRHQHRCDPVTGGTQCVGINSTRCHAHPAGYGFTGYRCDVRFARHRHTLVGSGPVAPESQPPRPRWIDRHPVDASATFVAPHLPQCFLQVCSLTYLLHDTIRVGWAFGFMCESLASQPCWTALSSKR
jgi:hypothetical protein